MREGAGPGQPDAAAFVTPERRRLADAVRHLVDAVVTAEDVGAVALGAAAEMAEQVARDLGAAEPGSPPSGTRARRERDHHDYLPRSPLVGEVSPLAPPIAFEHRGGRLYGHGVFHAAYEGPPGYVHGGWIALAFDELLGMTNIASGHPAMTGKLTIRYRRPTPLHTEVRFESWTEQVDGRRILARGRLTVDDLVTAEAEGLFVVIDAERALEYFGRTREYHATEAPDPLP